MVATVFGLAPQVTVLVRFCLLPSEYVPVAVNCCVDPEKTEALDGLTLMLTSSGGAGLTVRPVDPTMPADEAVTVAWPSASPSARP